MIVLSGWIGPGWRWCFVLLLAAVIVAVSIVIDACSADVRPVRRYALIMAGVMLVADTVWMVFFMWALFAPMLALLDSTSGQSSGKR